MSRRISEPWVVFLVGAVQFVNILDFLMVMPMGPDFARALHIDNSLLGYIGGSYTAAAAVSGLVGSFFLDRFDRRSALGVAMLGLVAGTAAGGFATGLRSLMAARVIAGVFGGPATSIAFSIIADTVPLERRGKAMGAVMGAFSVASVLGVPAGLYMAQEGGWRMPFFAVAGLGLLVAGSAIAKLPKLRAHLAQAAQKSKAPSFLDLLSRTDVLLSYTMTALIMMSGFILIPNLSAYIQNNLGYPRGRLGLLYLVGGTFSFFSLRLVGFLVDKWGSFRVGSLGVAMLLPILYVGFVDYRPGIPVLVLFVSFMVAMAVRNVSYNTLTSKVPTPPERARFMSLQSSIQHGASATGAFVSARMLRELPGGKLEGIPEVAMVSMALALVVPLLLWLVEERVKSRPPVKANSPVPGPVENELHPDVVP